MMDEPALLKTDQAATYLGLSVSLLNKLRLTGGGPQFARLAGRAIRYRKVDLDEWIEASMMRHTSEYNAKHRHHSAKN